LELTPHALQLNRRGADLAPGGILDRAEEDNE
jgi:hypothetical protein